MQEFDPVEHFYTYLRLWWLLLAAALLGGLAGFLFSRTHAPLYEAMAKFMVEIDLEKVPQDKLDFYYIDMALATTEGALISDEVLEDVYAEAARLGQATAGWDLLADTSIERRHAFWELRFRHPDPELAKALVNWWAQRGYEAMLQMQAEGLSPDYVVYSPPTKARAASQPTNFAVNKLVLAGSLIGWLVGLLLIELAGSRFAGQRKS